MALDKEGFESFSSLFAGPFGQLLAPWLLDSWLLFNLHSELLEIHLGPNLRVVAATLAFGRPLGFEADRIRDWISIEAIGVPEGGEVHQIFNEIRNCLGRP